ncbi:MAG: hypothetical protein ACREP9_01355, partial [Candidatus Dormibacteraceae bacterium]
MVNAMMEIGELATQIGASTEEVLVGLYEMALVDPTVAAITILPTGCTAAELTAAERRIGRELHPLHHRILTLANGGTLPYINSVSQLAAAVPRERIWRPLGGSSASLGGDAGDDVGSEDAVEPLLLGETLRWSYGNPTYRDLDLDDLIVIAFGFDGECFGYVRGTDDRVDFAGPEFGRG